MVHTQSILETDSGGRVIGMPPWAVGSIEQRMQTCCSCSAEQTRHSPLPSFPPPPYLRVCPLPPSFVCPFTLPSFLPSFLTCFAHFPFPHRSRHGNGHAHLPSLPQSVRRSTPSPPPTHSPARSPFTPYLCRRVVRVRPVYPPAWLPSRQTWRCVTCAPAEGGPQSNTYCMMCSVRVNKPRYQEGGRERRGK